MIKNFLPKDVLKNNIVIIGNFYLKYCITVIERNLLLMSRNQGYLHNTREK